MSGSGAQSASYLGTRYQLKDTYTAQTTYVQGEFYWRVERGQTTQNRDFVNGKSLLSLEQTPNEITWSSGGMMDSATIVKAFGLEDKKDMLQRSDVAPFSASGLSLRNVLIAVVVMLVLVALLSRCSSTPCDPATQNCSSSSSYGSRSSGGSFGGSSSGGGHK
jgi:hypothetical protein